MFDMGSGGKKDVKMKIYQGDAINVLKSLESESVNCIVTSPPLSNSFSICNSNDG